MIELFMRSLPLLKSAVLMTLFLGLLSFVLGSTLGLLVALARISSIGALRAFAFAYVSIYLPWHAAARADTADLFRFAPVRSDT
ncbi:ABC-type amino acid transport system permease subunit [Paraburkholderia sp. RAU6.4a]|uniref:hypothetical protein n=1 Tax=Paraburkholderia sp. RAU6.4a TaxID=2991067 RepID=UPI003D203873